jgi:ankyrin repeat protein
MENVAMKILERIDECNIGKVITNGKVTDNGRTALIFACWNKMESVAMKILERIDECNISQFDKNGCTALIWACINKMESVAMKILERIDKCNIGKITNNGSTALILACENKMENVAMKMLERIDKCNINKVNSCGNCALLIACKKNMENVIIEIIKYKEDINILFKILNKDIRKNVLHSYINYKSNKKLELLNNSDELKKNSELLEKIEQKILDITKKNECLLCCNENSRSVIYDKCKHIIYVCDVCNDKLYNKFSNKCSVCNQYSNVVERCYIIN